MVLCLMFKFVKYDGYSQRNASFSNALDRLFTDFDREYKVDNLDDGMGALTLNK